MKSRKITLCKVLVMLILLIGGIWLNGITVSAANFEQVYLIAGIELSDTNRVINNEDCKYISGYAEYIDSFEILLDNFKYDFEAAKKDGVELPKIFIYSESAIVMYIRGDVSFDYQSVDKETPSQGIISTDGHICIYNYKSDTEKTSLNIGVNGILMGASTDIRINGIHNMNLVNNSWYHMGIIAGASLYYDAVNKEIKHNYGEYGISDVNELNTYGLVEMDVDYVKLDAGDPAIIAPESIEIKNTIIEGIETIDSEGNNIIPEINSIVTAGTLTFNNSKVTTRSGGVTYNEEGFESSLLAKNIEITNGSEVRTTAVLDAIYAIDTVSINNSTVYAGIGQGSNEGYFASTGISGNNVNIQKSKIYTQSYGIGINGKSEINIEDSYVNSLVDSTSWYQNNAALTGKTLSIKNSEVIASSSAYASNWASTYGIKVENLNITNSDIKANTELAVYNDEVGKSSSCAIYVSNKLSVSSSNIEADVFKYSGDYSFVNPEGVTTGCANAIFAGEMAIKNETNINAYSYTQSAIKVVNIMDISDSKVILTSEKSQALSVGVLEGLYGSLSGNNSSDVNFGLDFNDKYVELTPSHSITAIPSQFGSLVVSLNVIRPNNVVVQGDEVTLLIMPINGYAIDEVIVYKSDDLNELIKVTNNKFTMPDYDVTIELVYKKLPEVSLNYGNSTENVIIESNTIPSAPIINDKIFMGWYDDEEYTIPHDFTKPLEDGCILYAKYVEYSDFTKDIEILSQNIKDAREYLESLINKKADKTTITNAISKLQIAIESLENAKCEYGEADEELKKSLEIAIEIAKKEAIEASKNYIPYIGSNGNWWIGDTDTGVKVAGKDGLTGQDGIGIKNIKLTDTKGNEDTYTVTLTNGDSYTFTVTNGINGVDGLDGNNYIIPIIISICALLSNVLMFLWILKRNKKDKKEE